MNDIHSGMHPSDVSARLEKTPEGASPAVEVVDLCRRYGDFAAVGGSPSRYSPGGVRPVGPRVRAQARPATDGQAT